MHKRVINPICILAFGFLFSSACDHGLAPDETEKIVGTGISGSIIYTGTWPVDSLVLDLKLVVFQNIPTDSTQVISDVIQGKAFVYPENLVESLPYGVSETQYIMTLDPGSYEYIVVAQQYGSIFQWRLVGQYDTNPGDPQPSEVTVVDNVMLTDIDIHVDWDNPPVQPF
jgi:hypothetical protein